MTHNNVLINTCMICYWITTSLTLQKLQIKYKKKEFLFFWHFLKKNIFPYYVITERFMRDTDKILILIGRSFLELSNKSKNGDFALIWPDTQIFVQNEEKRHLELHIPIIEEVMIIIKWNRIADLVLIWSK